MEESFKYHIPEDIPANERTAFHGAAAAAAKAGKKNFNFAGKTHPVTMKKDTATAIADQKESTMSFREKLMSIFESDRAKHYKSSAAAEPMDNNLKGAGAKKMKADIQGNAADPDLEKKSHDDAAKAGKGGPSMKARSNDNKKGDKKIINPPTDETKKGQGPKVATESYGVSGNTVSKGLLDAINQVTEKARAIRTNKVKGDRSMRDQHAETGFGMGGKQTYASMHGMNQLHYSKYISKKSGHDSYFDDVDLVHAKSSKTVVANALHGKHTPDQLAAKMKAHGDKHKG
jgi:hypothetical protein